MSPKTLNLIPIDYPFETLVQRIDSNPAKLKLDPEFQRKYKWDKDGWERASKFIESCLMRIPLPACYFAEVEDGSHIVIDGVQRLTTISRFFKDGFKLEGMTAFSELEGKTFSELGVLKSELEGTTIRCIVLRKENPKELIQEIFSRLNQGAVKLSDQEIRHAVYPGMLDKLLKELSSVAIIKTFKNIQKESREEEEMVLRFFALQEDLYKYGDRLSKHLDGYMRENQHCGEVEAGKMKTKFTSTLKKCTEVFGEKVFMDTNKANPRQSIVYYDLLMHSFTNIPASKLKALKAKIKLAFAELCNESEFQSTLSGGLQNRSSIIKRRTLWKKKIDKLLAKHV